jgi:hypothetical protein
MAVITEEVGVGASYVIIVLWIGFALMPPVVCLRNPARHPWPLQDCKAMRCRPRLHARRQLAATLETVRGYSRLLLRTAAGLMVLCTLSASRTTGGEENHTYVVGKITIEQRQVFDESDSTFLRKLGDYVQPVGDLALTARTVANDVHVMTREEVIRRELLFKEGDPYDQRLVDESARHLRKMGIIGDISITSDTLWDNSVDVLVKAHDRWTLNPSMSVQAGGGVRGFGVGLREENLFGMGQKVEVGYNRLSDRANPNGGQISFTEPRLFGSWWSTSAQWRDADELKQTSLDIQRPFFADAAEWSARGFASIGRVRIRQYQNGDVARDDYLNQENELVWLGSSSGSDAKLQLAAAYYRMRASSDSMELRPFDNVDLVIGSVSILEREYYKGSYIENFGRVEDVPIGYQVGLAAGRNLHFSSLGSVDYFARVFGQGSARFGGGLSGNYKASATSYFIGNTPNEMTISATALHFWRLAPDQTLLGRVTTTIGSHWAPSSQLTLGSFSGLRGYRSNEFAGQRLLLVNLEHRMFSMMNLWFFKLGAALFFDSGVVWNQGEGFGGQRFHSALGVGIQIESGKSLGNGIFRLDVAYNMDQKRIALVLSSDHVFRAFSGMEFIPPVPGAEQDQRSR